MDIQKYIKQEAPNNDKHDKAYAKALKIAYDINHKSSKQELIEYQKLARAMYARNGATHQNTARCMIVYELLKEDHGIN